MLNGSFHLPGRGLVRVVALLGVALLTACAPRDVPAGIDEVDALVASGALDDVDEALDRDDLRMLHRRLRWTSSTGTRDLRSLRALRDQQTMGVHGTRQAARIRDELGAMGMTLSGHPLDIVVDQLPDDLVQGTALRRSIGSRVSAAGWVAHVGGKDGGLTTRWRCEFDDGTALWAARIPDRLVRGALSGPWVLDGVVIADGADVLLEVDALRALDLEGADRAIADAV